MRRRDDRKRLPTLADIASAAKVSTATVSRVLNRSNLVRPDLRIRVEKAIDGLGYFPHGAARALASNRSFTIGAVIPTLNNAIFASGINAFSAALTARDYTLLLAVSDYSLAIEADEVRRLLERGIDGLLLVGNAHSLTTYEALQRAGTVYINTWIYEPDCDHPNVGFSNRRAIAQVADHLVNLGHRYIGMLAGVTAGNDRARDRLFGLEEALAGHGLALAERATREVAYSVRDARDALAALVQSDCLPTALVCGNDVIALGVLFEALERNIRVPEDLSITGFDNLPIVEHIRPRLTTVHVPAEQMGTLAAEALLSALDARTAVGSREVEASLLVGETTGPPARP